jgi:ACS family hexuronate transporter-like MFS transporter
MSSPTSASPTVAREPLPALAYDAPQGGSNFRWVILLLVFLAITINYVDRIVIGILAPDLRRQYNISDVAYGNITSAFALSYAFGQAISGRMLDRVGTRVGYALALTGWSLAGMSAALARSAFGFGLARAFLGFTQSPAFPGAVKTLAEWFPRKERALAMGIVNAGANIGSIVGPLVVPWLALTYGWQAAFVVTGAAGLLWLVLWLPLYRHPAEHPRVSDAELAHIQSDPPEPVGHVPWLELLRHRQTWGFVVGKFLTDPIWSFYLLWLPTFLNKKHGIDLKGIGLPIVTVYLMANVGSVAAGWLSSGMIHRGWSVNAARKTALLICTVCVIPVVFASVVPSAWAAVLLVGLATAAHQGFSSNLYTLVSDTFPKQACASVAGLGGTFGWGGTSLFAVLIGLILGKWTDGNYLPAFIISGSAYLVAFLAIHLLMPRLQPAAVGQTPAHGFPVVRQQ